MKKIVYAFMVLLVFSCKSQELAVKESQIKADLEYLAGDALQGRETGSQGIEKAAQYIEADFKANQLKPFFKTYRDSFNIKDIVGYNIVGFKEGEDPKLKNEFVILGAHYDHIGIRKAVNGDSIANGANDDASGTVAILAWARYFAKQHTKRSVLFTLYSGEEKGLKGSAHLAEKLKAMNLDVYTMLNIEMIGVPRDPQNALAYITGFDASNMAEKLNTYAGDSLIGFYPEAKKLRLFMRSDNYPFYQAFQIPAHAISTTEMDKFDYYHHVDDEPDKLNMEHMTRFVNKMIPALSGMINASMDEIKLTENE